MEGKAWQGYPVGDRERHFGTGTWGRHGEGGPLGGRHGEGGMLGKAQWE